MMRRFSKCRPRIHTNGGPRHREARYQRRPYCTILGWATSDGQTLHAEISQAKLTSTQTTYISVVCVHLSQGKSPYRALEGQLSGHHNPGLSAKCVAEMHLRVALFRSLTLAADTTGQPDSACPEHLTIGFGRDHQYHFVETML